jgi:DNA polymerase-1
MCDLLYGPGWTSAMRTIEKNIVFGLLYGGKLESLVSVAHIPDEVKLRVLNVFNTKLLRILAWRDELFNQAKTLGVITSPYFNRDFHFDLVTQANQRDIQKECVNYPVQGTAADITNLAMVRALPKLRSIGASIVATVHDSILVDTPIHRAIEAANILARELALAGAQVFPIIPWQAEAEMGFRWGELKPMELTHE